jgi:bacillithiol biosynthesis cysteine-adding enzyme BshC
MTAPPRVFEQIELLSEPTSRVVVTGQQAGLLLGPTFTLSKAFTAIKLATELTREGQPVIPIFWLASQDHDHLEIDHCHLMDKKETLHRLEVALPPETPAGRVPFEQAMLSSVERSLARGVWVPEYVSEVLALLERTGSRAATYADWFAALLYELLGACGLVVLNPMAPDTAALFKEVIASEIRRPQISVAAIRDAAHDLKRLGVEPQLGRGANASNLFVEEWEGGRVKRELLRFDGRHFFSRSASYSAENLLERLAEDPRSITPAAGLRPITQDAVLPTAITVVGPGELRYFAQLKGVYTHHGVEMPLVWPRTVTTVLEPPVSRILTKFGLSFDDYVADPDGSKARILLERHGHDRVFQDGLERLHEIAAKLLEQVEGIDTTLEGPVLRTEGRIENALEQLRTKAAAALARQDEVTDRQFGRLTSHLFPLASPQERLISPFSFFLKFGIEPFLEAFAALPSSGQYSVRL